mmetsp:Transcript_5910/g.8357  ORF Transcript_5910/g.8357 Transcript_5910/m.8357 type:complete len:337 (-) Transcript_5910:56-1066(-)
MKASIFLAIFTIAATQHLEANSFSWGSPSSSVLSFQKRVGLSYFAEPYKNSRLIVSTTSSSEETSSLTEPSEMKLREIQAELKTMKVDYSDCFDRDSLTKRLVEARSGTIKSKNTVKEGMGATNQKENGAESGSSGDEEQKTNDAPASDVKEPTPAPAAPTPTQFDREETLAQLRSLRVKELRTECAKRNIRWANMIEKEDLVQALCAAREKSSNFSRSGSLSPGVVTDIDDSQLSAELESSDGMTLPPLLLDVYATWCGPCQMMSPQLVAAATELGDTVRVAKIDSDKYPEWASKLSVGGLPTVIVFDGTTGKELQRVEGALMKDGLIDLAKSHV